MMGPPGISRGGASGAKGGGGGGAWNFMKSLYNDEFRWSLVKSTGLFLTGIWLAREFKGVELFGPGASGTTPSA